MREGVGRGVAGAPGWKIEIGKGCLCAEDLISSDIRFFFFFSFKGDINVQKEILR